MTNHNTLIVALYYNNNIHILSQSRLPVILNLFDILNNYFFYYYKYHKYLKVTMF